MQEKILCRVLTGPTGSGKSETALRIGKEQNWDIICMDSMQIYRGMDIGTAKPTREEQSAVPHFMLDICDPTESYSVSQYVTQAAETAEKRAALGRGILFVGGTGLYLEGMIRGMSLGSVPANPGLRAELQALAASENGIRKLDSRLQQSDPATAAKLPLNDIRRRIRAIEVSELTGVPFSRQENKTDDSRFRWLLVSAASEREVLYSRINRRVDRMIAGGLAAEVSSLLKAGVPEDAQSMCAIGYKEMIPYIRGECTLQTAAEEIRKNTRHYAKRQMTYLKRFDSIHYIDLSASGADEQIMEIFYRNEE